MPFVPPRLPLVATLVTLGLLTLTGCAEEAAPSTAGQGLAQFAPAGSLAYAEVVLRPGRDSRADLDRVLRRFGTGQTVEKMVRDEFKASPGSHTTYDRDVEPWLGARQAVVLTALHRPAHPHPEWATLVEVTDAKAAFAGVRKNHRGALLRHYAGVAYVQDRKHHVAAGVTHSTLITGTVRALKAVIDTAQTGDGLGSESRYTKVVDQVDDGAVAFGFADVTESLDAIGAVRTNDDRTTDAVRRGLSMRGVRTGAVGLAVHHRKLELRVATAGKGGAPTGAGAGADRLAGLPAGVSAAAATGDLGAALGSYIGMVRSVAGTRLCECMLAALHRATDIDVTKDLLPWMGSAGVFVRGSSPGRVGGALVIGVKDHAAARDALGKFKTLAVNTHRRPRILRGKGVEDGYQLRPRTLPVSRVLVALAGDRLIVAAGRAAFDQALHPTATFSTDPHYAAAAKLLGGGLRPTGYVDTPKVAGLIRLATDDSADSTSFLKVVDGLGTIVTGERRTGGVTIRTVIAELR